MFSKAPILTSLLMLAPIAAQADIRFRRACDPGPQITIGAIGDVLLHAVTQTQGFEKGFNSLWPRMDQILRAPNLTYANLEGPAGGAINKQGREVTDPGRYDGAVYTGYPQFNYPWALLDELQRLGVDVVSTANNHSMDRGVAGTNRTILGLDRVGIAHAGTRRSAEPRGPWHTITTASGFNIAWVACTYDTNGLPDPYRQVLLCFKDTTEILGLVNKLAKDPRIDAVIVTPHWGDEYTDLPSTGQRQLARRILDAGATAVIGSHPHVIQPFEAYSTRDGREGLVLYSLGNFISNQLQPFTDSSLVLSLGLTRTGSEKAHINGIRYLPLVIRRTEGSRQVEPADADVMDDQARTARAHAIKLLGSGNLVDSRETVVTNPGCR